MKITEEMIDRGAFGAYASWTGRSVAELLSPAEENDGRTWMQVYKDDWESDDLNSCDAMTRDDFRRVARAVLSFGLAIPDAA